MASGEASPWAIVTGASSGIGRATAIALAGRGYRVTLVARRVDRLREVADRIGPTATVLPVDISDLEAVEAMGPLIAGAEVLVHAAGHGLLKPMADQSPRQLQQLLNVHYLAAAAMIRHVLPGMLQRRRGRIIAVGSVSTFVAPWGHGGYSAAKSALAAMIRTLHAEHPGQGVAFCNVHPGVIATEFFDSPANARMPRDVMRHAIPAERVARAILRVIDRPRLDIVVPAHHGIVRWLGVVWPRLVHGRIARSSMPDATAARDAPDPPPSDTPAASDAPS